jgi:hypothetical protein
MAELQQHFKTQPINKTTRFWPLQLPAFDRNRWPDCVGIRIQIHFLKDSMS